MMTRKHNKRVLREIFSSARYILDKLSEVFEDDQFKESLFTLNNYRFSIKSHKQNKYKYEYLRITNKAHKDVCYYRINDFRLVSILTTLRVLSENLLEILFVLEEAKELLNKHFTSGPEVKREDNEIPSIINFTMLQHGKI